MMICKVPWAECIKMKNGKGDSSGKSGKRDGSLFHFFLNLKFI